MDGQGIVIEDLPSESDDDTVYEKAKENEIEVVNEGIGGMEDMELDESEEDTDTMRVEKEAATVRWLKQWRKAGEVSGHKQH